MLFPHNEEFVGKQIGSWLVIGKSINAKNGRWVYDCQCKCGTLRSIRPRDLRTGKSSRCDKCRATTHGKSNTNTYRIWQGMIYRCSNPNNTIYKYYGGRGIKVCERWLTFEKFLEDMGVRPEGLSIDRIDVNGDYEPLNCRWATQKEQNNNQRRRKG